MRITQQQLMQQLTIMQSIFDEKTYEYFRTITNMLTLSLYEFNRIKKITPLSVREDVIIIDEFNIYPDDQVESSFKDILRKFNLDIYPKDNVHYNVNKFTRLIQKYNQDSILRKLTAWHYIFISDNEERKQQIIDMICSYLMLGKDPDYESLFIIKGNIMLLNDQREQLDEDGMMINYMIKRGVLTW